MERYTFGPDEIDSTIARVSEEAKDRANTIAYTRVFEAAGLSAPQLLHQGAESQLVTDFMKAFHDRCLDQGLPPLDSLVVHVAGPRKDWPGAGYFKVNGVKDPKSERATGEEQVTATNFWLGEKAQCESWGTAQRRAGR